MNALQRAAVPRGGALFAAVVLLGCGGHLIEEQLANPLGAEAGALIFAALLIAAGTTLAASLLQAIGKMLLHAKPRGGSREITVKPIAAKRSQQEWHGENENLSLSRSYVDRTRARQ